MVRQVEVSVEPAREWLDRYRYVILARSKTAWLAALDQARHQWPGLVMEQFPAAATSGPCDSNSR
ncbi:MAG: hypothetical protein NTY38_12565 [Acidobacteria bacterium]|nr:hypothetical protein [Acidobacteriota bacterium]